MVVYRHLIPNAVCPNCSAEKVIELRKDWYRCENCGDEFGEYLQAYDVVEPLEDECRGY